MNYGDFAYRLVNFNLDWSILDGCMDAWMDGCMDGWMHG